MKIVIHSIADRGIANKERLALRVTSDTTLSYYVILDTAYITPNSIQTVPKNVFWFPPKPVKAGEWVLLYTRPATTTDLVEKILDDVTTAHIFYWGQPNVLWRQTGNCAVVLELSDWVTTPFQ